MNIHKKIAYTLPLLFVFLLPAVILAELPDTITTDSRAVPFYTGTVYPTPQQATYGDTMLPLNNVGLLLGEGIDTGDARVALLLERINRYGGKARIVSSTDEPCDTLILIGQTGAHAELLKDQSAPARAEGYLVLTATKGTKDYVFLQGHDFHGLHWAITSFNQLITVKQGQTVARSATILDYPDAPGKRGYTAMRDDSDLNKTWFAVNVLRANVVIYRQLRNTADWRSVVRNDARFTSWQDKIHKIGSVLTPLKVRWYDTMMPLSTSGVQGQIRSKSEEDFQLVVKAAMALAEQGGHLCLIYDDFRFPMHPDDVRDFGSARDAEVYFLNKVYAAVSERYPDFRILFCPPFYWGPASDPSEGYGESREAYLAAMGEKLPAGIDIYWTGPRVKSTIVTPKDVKWYTDLIRRKPVYWQNAAGVAHGETYYVFPTDAIHSWKAWYDKDFFNNLAFHTYNSADAYTTMTLFDAMWNRKAYEPTASSQTASKKLVGTDAYPKLVEAFELLESLDTYGWFKMTSMAAKHIDNVRSKTEQLSSLVESAPATLKNGWIPLAYYVLLKERYLARLIENPDLKSLTEVDDIVRRLAIDESGADPTNHLILTPNDFVLNRPPRYYKWKDTERRYAVWINGKDSSIASMQSQFQLPYHITGHSDLIIAGLDHNAKPPCRIRIEVNGHVVFEGHNPFKADKWTTHRFQVKGAYLRDGVSNTLKISNIEDSSNISGAPWFMLNYAVLQPQP